MEQKIKIILIVLAAFLLVSIFFSFQTLTSKAAIQRQRDKMSELNAALEEKLGRVSRDYQRLEEKASSINREYERLRAEKEDFQVKYDSLDKTREELMERVKSLQSKAEAVHLTAAVPAPVPETTDGYWAQVLKEKTTLEMQLQSLRSQLKSLQINNEQLEKEKSALTLEINNLNLDKQDLKRQLVYNQKQLSYNQKLTDNVALELVGEKNDKSQIKDTYRAVKSENLILRRQLKTLSGRKIALERKAQELEDQNTRLEKRFSEMDILLKDKIMQLDKVKNRATTGMRDSDSDSQPASTASVELPPIVVRPQATNVAEDTAGKITVLGRILAVNKENNFVIIDLGEASGVKVGDTFQVARDNELIATISVIQVRKSISACDIKKEDLPLRIGDTLR